MRFVYLYLFLQAVSAQICTGSCYNENSPMCQKWACLNQKLNYTNEFPPKDDYIAQLQAPLPPGDWKYAVNTAVNYCYNLDNINKKFAYTCPGQSLMHCVVDKLIQICPYQMSDVSCARVQSAAGTDYMFSQRRYDIVAILQQGRQPENYISSNCCNFPQIVNQSLLNECGFTRFMELHYHDLQPSYRTTLRSVLRIQDVTPTTASSPVTGQLNNFNTLPESTTAKLSTDFSLNDSGETEDIEPQDPLDCCEIDGFINPNWRSECDFKMHWDSQNRLTIGKDTAAMKLVNRFKNSDIEIIPMPCQKLEPVFQKLNIVSDTGHVNQEAFVLLLDNMTSRYPTWGHAKDEVIRQCLGRQYPSTGYDQNCLIHNILSCTFDVLSENCPVKVNNSICGSRNAVQDGVVCQVSTSMYRPANRRPFCNTPYLVDHRILSDFGLLSLFRVSHMPAQTPPFSGSDDYRNNCTVQTAATTCLLNKMGVLNIYGFVDYFKMKDKIRAYSNGQTFSPFILYNGALLNTPHYGQYCSGPKKLLNVLDSMLTVCDISKRKTNRQCNNIFSGLRNSISSNAGREKLDQAIRFYQNVYFPVTTQSSVPATQKSSVRTNPLYDFGLLGNRNEPPVVTLDLKPREKPLVLLPAYQRKPKSDPFQLNSLHNDGVWRM